MTGRSAFGRLFTEQISSVMVDLPDSDEPVPLMEALSRLQDPDRELRAEAAEAVTAALEPGLRTRAFIFNTLLQDKSTKDRLRSYEHWLAARNLSNEASDESVAALIEAVVSHYELARRWYRLKAKLLGLGQARALRPDGAGRHSRSSGSPTPTLASWSSTATAASRPSWATPHPDSSRATTSTRRPRPGKRGGAFCAYTVPSAHPYVMLNYTSRSGDVLTMAHELGHGVHAFLAGKEQSLFQVSTPLTVAETASIFGETIVLERLLEDAPDAEARLSLLAESLDGAVAAVFRQVAMNRFEDRIHCRAPRRPASFRPTRSPRHGSRRRPTSWATRSSRRTEYGTWWSYVPHFVDTPGYVYAYAYGHLLALSVYRRYQETGAGFVPVVSGAARGRRLALARGPRRDRRRRPHRPGLLDLGPRADRGAARRRREGGGRGGPDLDAVVVHAEERAAWHLRTR